MLTPQQVADIKSPEMQQAHTVPASITSNLEPEKTIHDIKNYIIDYLASKNYKLIKPFESGTLSISNIQSDKQLFQAIFNAVKLQLIAAVSESKDKDVKLLTISHVFTSINHMLEVLTTQDITTSKENLVAVLSGLLIKNL